MAGVNVCGCRECRLQQYWTFRCDGYTPAEAADLVNRLAEEQPAT